MLLCDGLTQNHRYATVDTNTRTGMCWRLCELLRCIQSTFVLFFWMTAELSWLRQWWREEREVLQLHSSSFLSILSWNWPFDFDSDDKQTNQISPKLCVVEETCWGLRNPSIGLRSHRQADTHSAALIQPNGSTYFQPLLMAARVCEVTAYSHSKLVWADKYIKIDIQIRSLGCILLFALWKRSLDIRAA